MLTGMRNRFPNGKKVTISDVAARVGVSKTTVSKLLSATEYYIAADTRRRIEDAIRELDFRPNAVAQGLSNRRSQAIGVVVASVENPFYPELIAGVEEVIGLAGYTLLLGSSDGKPKAEADVVRSMMQRQVDGLVMASVTMRDHEVERIAVSGVDVVLASRNLARHLVDTVTVDNHAGAVAATAHLVEHGHRRIAHIAGPQNIVPFRLRTKGYRTALEDAGLPFQDDLVVRVRGSRSGEGARALRALLSGEKPPTAVFVASDTMALAVLEECERRGVRVPDDLAVVGFDNIWVGRLPGVSLTTVDGKARQIGRTAASLLCQRIADRADGDDSGPPQAEQRDAELVVLQSNLVTRTSCGC
jgi:LacI family transcriptional regulator